MRKSLADGSYNLVVVGGGAAGLVSAYIAAAVKAKVALIERHKLGGDCLNTGCVPSKALIKTAKVVAEIKAAERYGIKSATYELDFAQVMDRVRETIRTIEPHDSAERYTSLGVECIAGQAELVDRHTVRVNGRTLRAKALVLALGAEPFVPEVPGLDRVKYLTSDNLWDLRVLPKRLVVLGGGPIGCELAQAFQRLGSQVTQVEMQDRILPREDPDVAALVAARFREEGVTLLTGTRAAEVRVTAAGRFLVCESPSRGRTEVPFDELLVAVGRRARTHGVDWSALGVELNPNGTVKVDEYLRANGDNVYACGDLVGPYQFTHVASHQAWYCAVNALFAPFKKFKVDYRVIPWVTFTDPEVAQVGHNETSARAAGLPYEVSLYGLDDLDRAITESEGYGQVKILTVPGKDRILGANIVGHNAGEMLQELTTAMKHGLGLNKILGTIHPYPTFAEANKYAAGVWKKAHAPAAALKWLERLHAWRR